MDIQFDRTAEDDRRARLLYAILQQYYSTETDNLKRADISTLQQQLESYLADPALGQYGGSMQNVTGDTASSSRLADIISSLWGFIAGPSRKEIELSKQRQEQLERAEHAESSAFEALAESADLKHALDEAQRKIHELEAVLDRGAAKQS